MTAGEDALREAARLETARIYSQLCKEPPKEPVDTPVPAMIAVDLAAARLRRAS